MKKQMVLALVGGAVLSLLLFLPFSEGSATPLVTNGGFEDTPDFFGWTLTGAPSAVDPSTFHSGTKSANFFAVDLGYIEQTLATTAGATYLIDFWIKHSDSSQNEFILSWHGTTLLDLVNADKFDWTEYTFNVTAVGNDVLKFGAQDPAEIFWLDDVSVTESVVPEPSTILLLGSGLAGLAAWRRKHAA